MPAITRRRLLTGLGVVVAGGAGVALGAITTHPSHRGYAGRSTTQPPPAPPALLVSALAREQSLLDRLHGAANQPGVAAVVGVLASDHQKHAEALRGLLGNAEPSTPTSSSSTTTGAPVATRTEIVAAERSAATAAATESSGETGAAAVLLASISACEASHVAWLS